MDVSVHDNIIKEVKEESGLDVTVDTVIAIQDREKHNQPVYGKSARYLLFAVL